MMNKAKRKALVFIVLLSIPSLAYPCTMTWDAVTTYTDGSPITATVIYKLTFTPTGSTVSQVVYQNIANTATFLCLAGSYYVTAYTANDTESDKSNVLTLKQVSPPVKLKYGN